MKKSLKALFLCALTSLVMFAVVYASPIVAKAATHQLTSIVDENNNALTGCSVTITYSDDTVTLVSGSDYNYAMVYNVGNSVYAFIVLAIEGNEPSVTGSAAYTLVYKGQTYVGSTSLTNEFFANESITHTYLCSEVLLFDGGATGYGAQINDLKNHIGNISKDATLTGENRVVEFNVGTALPKSVISTLANSENVTLKFTFVYEGYEFCTTITSEAAKKVYNPKVEWAGPCYLADNFPTVWTGKTVK